MVSAVVQASNGLEGRLKIDIPSLRENDEFIDAILKLTPLAQATSQNEKREAFKNALGNIAMGFHRVVPKRVFSFGSSTSYQ
jgi:hypothetical protein